MNKIKLEEILLSLSELKTDWDNYGALPINKASIELARKVGPIIPDYWSVVPGLSGGIAFEHQSEGLIELYAEDSEVKYE